MAPGGGFHPTPTAARSRREHGRGNRTVTRPAGVGGNTRSGSFTCVAGARHCRPVLERGSFLFGIVSNIVIGLMGSVYGLFRTSNGSLAGNPSGSTRAIIVAT